MPEKAHSQFSYTFKMASWGFCIALVFTLTCSTFCVSFHCWQVLHVSQGLSCHSYNDSHDFTTSLVRIQQVGLRQGCEARPQSMTNNHTLSNIPGTDTCSVQSALAIIVFIIQHHQFISIPEICSFNLCLLCSYTKWA